MENENFNAWDLGWWSYHREIALDDLLDSPECRAMSEFDREEVECGWESAEFWEEEFD